MLEGVGRQEFMKKMRFYKLWPASKTDHVCQLWQSSSDLPMNECNVTYRQ